MEIDDLKKSWNKLDAELQKGTIIDEHKVQHLISTYEQGAHKNMNRITGWQKISVITGIVVLFILAFITLHLSSWVSNPESRQKVMILIGFFGVTLVAATLWDLRTYVWSRNTRIDEMPILTVIGRMNKFKNWVRYELVFIALWIIAINGLVFYLMEYAKEPWYVQAIFIAFFIIFDVTIVYLLYKKVFYDNWKELKKNLNELKELKS